jgi:hypothetical protein
MNTHQKSASRLVLWCLSLLGAVVVVCVYLLLAGGHAKAPVTSMLATPSPSSSPQPASSASKILFFGDMYFGRAVNVWAQASPLKYGYPFSGLSGFEREKYDAWIANFECPSVPGVQQSYATEVEYLRFNCPAEYLPEMSKWFSAVSLANNHTANQNGQAGLTATKQALQAQGVQHFGSYDPAQLADTCELVSVASKVVDTVQHETPGTVPLALCGYHGLGATLSAETLDIISQYAKHFPVVVYPHMGVEYTATPTKSQQDTYHAFIDAGADAVLGSHPHWVQPAEVYKGKLIVYSMGNFMFDQPAGETQRGAAIGLRLTLSGPGLAEQLQLGSQCSAAQDDCLAQAVAADMPKPQAVFVWDAQGVDMSNRLTKPAVGNTLQLVLDRLNWSAVQAELASSSTKSATPLP